MAVRKYNPKEVTVTVGAFAISGFSDGSFVRVEFDEDHFSKRVGTDGEVTRTQTNNYTGKISITLDQASPSNDVLSGIAALDRASGAGIVSSTVRDVNGTSLAFAQNSWVMKQADIDFANESQDREWVMDCGQMDVLVGGANEATP
jgi:hypothetical protein